MASTSEIRAQTGDSALLTYDAVSFLKYLDNVVAAHSPPPGSTKHDHSPWLFLDAAHVLFQTAKSRAYRGKIGTDASGSTTSAARASLQPVLEEQPKWAVLAEVLDEIERDAYLHPTHADESNSTILIMCSDQRTCFNLREYLETMQTSINQRPDGNSSNGAQEAKASADLMMRRRLRDYLEWKRMFSNVNKNLSATSVGDTAAEKSQESSAPLNARQSRAPAHKRRRIRGGATSLAPARAPNSSVQPEAESAGQVSGLLDEIQPTEAEETQRDVFISDDLEDTEDFYELYDMNDLVMIHPYAGDMDEQILEEVRPRYIIMYEPDAAFIRRVEVYRSSHVGRNVRVYFMYYGGSVEEQRYLSAVRREKDSFTKLIKEKSVSCPMIP